MTVPILRDYQARQKTGIYEAWNNGARNVLAVLPTGGGKSVEISALQHEYAFEPHYFPPQARNGYSAIIAHRQELVGQMSMHVASAGIKHRIIGPKNVVAAIVAQHRQEFGRSFIDPTARASVAGVDTLVARKTELEQWAQQVGFWTIDEAHHVLKENKWGKAVEMFPNAFGLGVTASPERPEGNGLGTKALGGAGVFDEMVVGPSLRELIDMGALTDYELALPESDFDVEHLRITASGDFSPEQMREASAASQIVGDVVEQYIRLAYGKRGIVFATDVKTASEMAERFAIYGIPAVAISGKTDGDLRIEYIRRFRAGKIWVLVNVDLFGEGFDVPAIEFVSMARPTASLIVFLQQIGRALRLLPGKRVGLIIDHVSNFKRHGFPDRPRVWSLASRERRRNKVSDPDDMPVKVCSECRRGYSAVLRGCPYCGHVPVPVGGGRSIEQVDGDLMLLDADTLAKMRAAAALEAPGVVATRAGFAAGPAAAGGALARQQERIASQTALKDAIAVWAGYQRALGRPDEQSYRRFYHATHGIDVISALALPRVEMDKLRGEIETWTK